MSTEHFTREAVSGATFREKLERRITEHEERKYAQTHAPYWVLHRRINGRTVINRRHQAKRRWAE